MKEKIKIFLLFIIVFSAISYPIVRNYKQNNISAAFSYLAGDSFYYLKIADNFSKTGFFTFDGTNPTNGFHPLWQMYLGNSFRFIHDKDSQLLFSIVSSVIFTSIGLFLVLLTLFRLNKKNLLFIAFIIPGLFHIVFSFMLGGQYSSWSIINCMESSLSVLFFGLFFYLFNFPIKKLPEYFNFIVIYIVLALLTFSRLDDIFLVIAFILFIFFIKNKSEFSGIKPHLPGIILFSVLIMIYLLWNFIYAGTFLPISGALKSHFAPWNIVHLINTFLAFSANYLYGTFLFQRTLPIIFSLIFGFIIIFKANRNHENETNIDNFISILAGYITLKALYNFLFVDFWHQGYWYFVLPVLCINIISIYYLGKIDFEPKKKYFLASLFLVLLFSSGFIETKRFENSSNSKLYAKRIGIRKILQNLDANIKLIEMDDGIISYCLDIPAISGFGLASDKITASNISSDNLLPLAYQQGFHYLASLNYFEKPSKINMTTQQNSFIRQPFFQSEYLTTKLFKFTPVLLDDYTGLVVLRIDKVN